ncbi:MAG: nucleotidyl transferase AbiEii/AbiGii toxin family protein [Deltaproteobacteria bacterium]|nr:nucleotidyl transferase AbiEii/AbiGii toxin family protein [Deltaproteobacteria bacterium]
MTYATPAALKAALEHRLRERFPTSLVRARQLVVFSRFLARIVAVLGDTATLKGGVVLELRLAKARTTKDIDLGLRGTQGERDLVLAKLQEAARLDLGDFMVFEVEPDPDNADITNEGMRYDGFRFRATCQLAGKEYGRRFFGIDVALGDPIGGRADNIVTEDWLGFAGIPPPTVRVYRVETHIAEKLHAYTMPRGRPNSRMKDLPDLALLGTARARLDRQELRAAIHDTFAARATHGVPTSVPDPPREWADRYTRLATEEELPWTTLPELLANVRAFLDPVLTSDGSTHRWDRASWSWIEV